MISNASTQHGMKIATTEAGMEPRMEDTNHTISDDGAEPVMEGMISSASTKPGTGGVIGGAHKLALLNRFIIIIILVY